VRPEEVRIGARGRVGESHRIVERGGQICKVVGRYGGEDYVAGDVTFPEGGERLFWPRDLEEVAPPPSTWWRSWKTYTFPSSSRSKELGSAAPTKVPSEQSNRSITTGGEGGFSYG
jgi:hypothetical protein